MRAVRVVPETQYEASAAFKNARPRTRWGGFRTGKGVYNTLTAIITTCVGGFWVRGGPAALRAVSVVSETQHEASAAFKNARPWTRRGDFRTGKGVYNTFIAVITTCVGGIWASGGPYMKR